MVDIPTYRIQPLPPSMLRAARDPEAVTRRWIGYYEVTPEAAEGAAPELEWVDPAPGTTIRRNQAITVRVVDDALAVAVLSVRMDSVGLEEVAYRNGRFSVLYRGSEVTEETDGDLVTITWVLRRTGGWPATPTIQADVVDTSGQSP